MLPRLLRNFPLKFRVYARIFREVFWRFPRSRCSTPQDAGPCFRRKFISCGSELELTNRGLLTPTPNQPRLGLVARSRGPTQICIRGVCHWTGEPKSRRAGRAVESQSRRATERARGRQPSPPRPLRASTPVAVPDAPRNFDAPLPPHSAFRLLSLLAHTRTWPFAVAKATGLPNASATRLDVTMGPQTSRDPPTEHLPAIPHRPCSSPDRRSSPLCRADKHLFYHVFYRLPG